MYAEYGFCVNVHRSFQFEGPAGMRRMEEIMDSLRRDVRGKKIAALGSREVQSVRDYGEGLDGLPASNVLAFKLAGGSAVIRPSGTEPKLKAYICGEAESEEAAGAAAEAVAEDLRRRIGA